MLTTTWATPAGAASTAAVKVTLASRVLSTADVGKAFEMRVTPSGAAVDCRHFGLAATTAGKSTPIAINYYDSGCWTGGIDLDGTVTRAMVGRTITMTSNHTVQGGKATFAGQVTIGSQVSRTSRTVPRPAAVRPKAPKRATSVRPAPSAKPTRTPAATKAPNGHPSHGAAAGASLDRLPRIPWEGGAAYYKRFPDAVKAGWADPNHFPVAVWWSRAGSQAEVTNAKKLGINTYVLLNQGTDNALLQANRMSYLGKSDQPLKHQTAASTNIPGVFLEDEADGWGGDNALNIMKAAAAKQPNHRKFRYANFTGMTYSWLAHDAAKDRRMRSIVNDYTDVISSDSYWYLSNGCDQADVHGDAWLTPFTKANCRTPQAYGRNTTSLRARDALDGKLQPTMTFVEGIAGGTDNGQVNYMPTGAQIGAAGMSSLIHEARGLVWFNQSFGKNPCATGDAVGSFMNPSYPARCKDDIRGMAKVNNLAQSLAPVLNTQSYVWNFGAGLDTMLKSKGGAAYVFAMTKDAGANSGPGTKKFTVPAALKGKKVSVVGENRTIAMKSDGTFTDTFPALTTYHVYKIA